MRMKYYAGKKGKYLGASNIGSRPDGAEYELDVGPADGSQVWQPHLGEWVDRVKSLKKAKVKKAVKKSLAQKADSTSKVVSYAAKVAGYSAGQVHNALRFAKDPAKVALLKVRMDDLAASV